MGFLRNGTKIDSNLAFHAGNLTDMVGATPTVAGIKGLVPAPPADAEDKFLRGDAQWASFPTTIPNADQLSTARTISLSGEVTGSITFDGSANVTMTTAVVLKALPLSTIATDIKMNGTQSLGVLATLPRADHVHPTDTTREPSITKKTGFNLDLSVTATDIKMNGVQALGSLSTLARADHVHPSDSTKEGTIGTGTAAQYWNGSKAWTDFATSARAVALTGFSTATATAVVATDTMLAAHGKLQGQINAINTSKGAVSGIATLDAAGKVPTAQLPSYVDDVVEAANFAALPGTGETGKIYVTLDTNKTYRWSGSAYVEISASLALGETSSTAYRGDYGAIAYTHSQASHAYAATAHAHGNITSAGAIGSTASLAVMTGASGVLTTGTIPVASGGTGATTAAAALTNLGLTATAAELNYMDGVTSNAQTQLDSKVGKNSATFSIPAATGYGYVSIAKSATGVGDCYGRFEIEWEFVNPLEGSPGKMEVIATASAVGISAATENTQPAMSLLSLTNFDNFFSAQMIWPDIPAEGPAYFCIYNDTTYAVSVTVTMIGGKGWTFDGIGDINFDTPVGIDYTWGDLTWFNIGSISARQLRATAGSFSDLPPIIVSSEVMVPNLNVEMLGGKTLAQIQSYPLTAADGRTLGETFADYNTLVNPGKYFSTEATLNRPASYCIVNVDRKAGGATDITHHAHDVVNNKYFIRTSINSGSTWSSWRELGEAAGSSSDYSMQFNATTESIDFIIY